MTRIASVGRNYPGKYKVVPQAATGRRPVVCWVDNVRNVLWAIGSFGALANGSMNQANLYRSDDNGVTFTIVLTLGTRQQTKSGVDDNKLWQDNVFAVRPIHGATPADDVLIITGVNQTAYDATVWYSTSNIYEATFTKSRAIFGDGQGKGATVAYSAAANDVFTAAGHGFVEKQQVVVDTSGGGLTAGTPYHVMVGSISGDTFKLVTTPGGATAVNITGDITGTISPLFHLGVGSAYANWSLDANDDYAIIGEYQAQSATGALSKSIWKSTDSGRTWSRVWYQLGNGSSDKNAVNLHCHMARIDPDGGCWISFGDHITGWNTANETYGLWHSPAEPALVTAAPAALDYGDFTRVYSHTSEQARLGGATYPRVRPITGWFREVDGAKYFYVGEDSMTVAEARTITRIRYDDASYAPEIKANYSSGVATMNFAGAGGIFGTCQIDDLHIAALSTLESTVSPNYSSLALLLSSDGGETWTIDENFSANQASVSRLITNAKGLCRYADSDGYIWLGRVPDDMYSFAYKPVFP